MPDWRRYVRERLHLPGLRLEREAEIVEDVAQQLDDVYRGALERGATDSEAERAAQREIQDWRTLADDLTRSDVRNRRAIDQRAVDHLEEGVASGLGLVVSQITADLLHGFRILLKRPGFTAAVLAVLALGIGANAAVFTIFNAVVLRPLPYAEPERLVRIWESNPSKEWTQFAASQPNFLDWREQSASFEQLAASTSRPCNLTGDGEAERIPGMAVTHEFFPMLGVSPMLGRNFLPEEDRPGHGERVVLIGRGLWERRFGADPAIVGRAIMLDDAPHTVIGVVPDFNWRPFEVFLPLRPDPNERRADHRLGVYGRLRPGVGIEAAQAELAGVAEALARQYPDSNHGWTVALTRFYDWVVPNESRRALRFLMGAVTLVLLIACANVAGLILARASGRRREIAIRAALGASRLRLIRQLLVESLLLAMLGGGLGLLCAQWGIGALGVTSEAALPRAEEITLDYRVILFTVGLSLLTGVLFGLAPALQATRVDLHGTLKDAAPGGAARQRARSTLVVVEVGLSLILLVGVGLLIRSLTTLLDVPPGFDTRNILTASITLPGSRYPSAKESIAFNQRLLERLRGLPGVEAVALTSGLPMDANATVMEVHVEGAPAPAAERPPLAQWRLVSPDYFRTMGIRIKTGRQLSESDLAPETYDLRGAVISEELAGQLWPGQDPIGRQFHPWSAGRPPITVVGVASDVRLLSLDQGPTAAVYLTFAGWNPTSIALRTTGDPRGVAGLLRGEVRAIDPGVPVGSIRTMAEILDGSTASRRLTLTLLASFATAALLLAGIGLFGLMAFLVTQRTHEIGIRMALGARKRDIFRPIVGRAMLLTSLGIAAGVAGLLVLTRTMSSMLFGVGARDPLTLFATALLLVLVALVACWIPARRATRIDPMVALRCE